MGIYSDEGMFPSLLLTHQELTPQFPHLLLGSQMRYLCKTNFVL